jgi:hypothetical protein
MKEQAMEVNVGQTLQSGLDVEPLRVRAGDHPVAINGQEVAQTNAKPLPASD